MDKPPAAGIIPYIVVNNERLFLLGYEKSKWSGFVGGYEDKDVSIITTAIREFNEESAMTFSNYTDYIYRKINNSACFVDKTPSGRNVYLWFIEFPVEAMSQIENFQNNKKIYRDRPTFIEKSKIQLFTADQVKNAKNIFYLCKRRINAFNST